MLLIEDLSKPKSNLTTQRYFNQSLSWPEYSRALCHCEQHFWKASLKMHISMWLSVYLGQEYQVRAFEQRNNQKAKRNLYYGFNIQVGNNSERIRLGISHCRLQMIINHFSIPLFWQHTFWTCCLTKLQILAHKHPLLMAWLI